MDYIIDLLYNGIPLLSKDVRDVNIVHTLNDLTLHHRATIVVLDVSFPATLRHVAFLVEPLLLEKLNGIVVSICQEILEVFLLGMVLQLVHQSSPKTSYLLLCGDSEEHNFGEPLCAERSEYAAS